MDFLFQILVSFLCVQSVAVESELICSQRPIVALVGGDVILPCHLEPPISVIDETVVWTRSDLKPKYVHYHQDGGLMFEHQNSDYFLRTRLFMDGLTNGNVSMKIFSVKLSDAGTYSCSLPSMKKEASIQLIVMGASLFPRQCCPVERHYSPHLCNPDSVWSVCSSGHDFPVARPSSTCLPGESEVIGSHEPVIAAVANNVILPCRLEPPFDVTTQIVEWKHSGTKVHLYHSKKNHLVDQDENFIGRTSLFYDEMIRGNISLKLINITERDAGNYTCFVHKLIKRGYVTLIIYQKDHLDSGDGVVGRAAIIVTLTVICLLVLLPTCVVILWKFSKRRKLSVSQQSPHKFASVDLADKAGNSPTEELTGEEADLKSKLHEEEETVHQPQTDLKSQSLPVCYFQRTASSSFSRWSLDDSEPFSIRTRNLSDDQNLKSLASTDSNPSKPVNSPQTRTQKLPAFSINMSQSQPCLTTTSHPWKMEVPTCQVDLHKHTHTQFRQCVHRCKRGSKLRIYSEDSG